jgi:parallel beta-helix repeat protein
LQQIRLWTTVGVTAITRIRPAVLLCLACLVASGCAVSSTEPASRVSTSEADVSGTIASTIGGPTQWWFEYGPTTAYGEETERRVEDLGDEPSQVFTTLRDLQPEAVYHFRLCSQDEEPESPPGCSRDRSFRTGLACGSVITQDTTLDADVNCDSGSALVIGAPGITLDLAGHEVRGGNTPDGDWTGVDNTGGHDGVIVKNGTVRYHSTPQGPGRAIVFEEASDGLLQNLDVVGVARLAGDRNRVAGSGFNAFYDSSLDVDGDDNQILYSSASNVQGVGLELSGARNTLANSDMHGSLKAVDVEGSEATVIANDIHAVPGLGLEVSGSGHRIIDNDLGSGSFRALWVSGASNAVVRDNRVDGGFVGEALVVESSSGTNLRANTVSGQSDGIFVTADSTGTLIRLNTARGEEDDGIDVDSASASLGSNTANGSGDLGIEAAAGVTDLGGNRAIGNGNPLQCVNVFCQ